MPRSTCGLIGDGLRAWGTHCSMSLLKYFTWLTSYSALRLNDGLNKIKRWFEVETNLWNVYRPTTTTIMKEVETRRLQQQCVRSNLKDWFVLHFFFFCAFSFISLPSSLPVFSVCTYLFVCLPLSFRSEFSFVLMSIEWCILLLSYQYDAYPVPMLCSMYQPKWITMTLIASTYKILAKSCIILILTHSPIQIKIYFLSYVLSILI